MVPVIEGRGHPGLRRVRPRLRGPRPQGPRRHGERRRPLRGDRLADQPRDARHGPVGPAPHARPGRDLRRRGARAGRAGSRRPTPARSPASASARSSRSRPPTTTGSSRAPSPACSCVTSRSASRAATASTTRLRRPRRALRARTLEARPRRGPRRRRAPGRARSRRCASRSSSTCTGSGATSTRTSTRSTPSRPSPHPELDLAYYGLSIWDLDRRFLCDGLAGRERGDARRRSSTILRDAYCRTFAIEYMHIQDPVQKRVDPAARRGRHVACRASRSSATCSSG